MSTLRRLLLALVLTAPLAANAAFVGFGTTLSPANEVPPVAGSVATGLGFFVFDDVTKLLTWDITFADLSAPATAAHIHNEAAGANGPAVIFLDPNPGLVLSGLGQSSGRFVGSDTLSVALEGELFAGRLYVNIHTPFAAGGEIRGQILPAAVVPLPAAAWLMAPALVLLARRKRRG